MFSKSFFCKVISKELPKTLFLNLSISCPAVRGKSTTHLFPSLIRVSLFQRDSNIPSKVYLYVYTYTHTHTLMCDPTPLPKIFPFLECSPLHHNAFLFWMSGNAATTLLLQGELTNILMAKWQNRKMKDVWLQQKLLLALFPTIFHPYLSIIPCMLTLPSDNLPALEASCQTHFSIPSSKCLDWR